jgi:hypothetical protein
LVIAPRGAARSITSAGATPSISHHCLALAGLSSMSATSADPTSFVKNVIEPPQQSIAA